MPVSRRRKYAGFALLILASVAAGAAGAALLIRAAVGTIELAFSPGTTPAAKKIDLTKVSAAMRGTVSFYKKRNGATLTDAALLQSDFVGNGVVVTSDGWLMTASSVLTHDSLVAVGADRTVLALDPKTIVKDEATGLAFVRYVQTARLPVAAFGDDGAVTPGTAVFALDPLRADATTVVSALSLPVSVRADLVESTERLSRRMIIDALPAPGTAIVNASGEALAVVTANGEAVPISFVTPAFKSVFLENAVNRPHVGLQYISADLVAYAAAKLLPRTGAVLTASAKARAVERGSEVELAGFKEGDVIIAVERDRVDASATLAELLNEYSPGATIELTALRDGKEIKATVTLK